MIGSRQAFNLSSHALSHSQRKLIELFARVNSYFHLSSLRAMLCRLQVLKCAWAWFQFVKVLFHWRSSGDEINFHFKVYDKISCLTKISQLLALFLGALSIKLDHKPRKTATVFTRRGRKKWQFKCFLVEAKIKASYLTASNFRSQPTQRSLSDLNFQFKYDFFSSFAKWRENSEKFILNHQNLIEFVFPIIVKSFSPLRPPSRFVIDFPSYFSFD